ncbi:MAG: AlpA family transcriptional regulator [Chloroflexi bacterium]|nr:AlpA family transcriptional regulator [Chloroflexota bacterium]
MSNNRLLRRPEVEARTGLARSTLYRMMDEGMFPRPVRIGRRAVAWSEEAIERWIAQRPIAEPADPHIPVPSTA